LFCEVPRTEVEGVGVGVGFVGAAFTTTDSLLSLHFVVTGALAALPL
jgi:hypothetical protein